jgi:MFS family permease
MSGTELPESKPEKEPGEGGGRAPDAASSARESGPRAQDAGAERPASERVDGLPAEWTPRLRRIMNRITLAGCLAMVYMELTSATPRTDLLLKLKASYQQFGIIEAIPPAMLLMQFVAGLLVHRLRTRKGLWVALLLTQRLMAIPFALLPFVFRDLPTGLLIWCMIGCIAVADASANLGLPLWFSWMSEILPLGTMGEFWARRRRWLAVSSTATLLASAAFFLWFEQVDIRATYLIVASVGALAGILDILLFIRIPEPRMEQHPPPDWTLVFAPFRDVIFRRFIFFMAYWVFAAAFGWAFFRVYMLKRLQMDIWTVQVIFACHALGGVLFCAAIGRLTDKFGSRPVIVLSSFLKSFVVISLFVARPGFWGLIHLVPMFMLDNVLNTGFFVAHNNFMLKH